MTGLRRALLLAAIGSAVITPRGWAQWPGFRGGLLRDAIARDVGLLDSWPEEGPPLAWERGGLGDGASTLAVDEGVVYTAGSIDGRVSLHALRLSDGRSAWSTPVGGGKTVTPTPMVDSGRVYLQFKGRVFCFDASDGRSLWSVEVMKLVEGDPEWKDRTHYGSWHGSPIVADGKVFVVTGHPEGPVIALDAVSGGKLWQCRGQREASCRGWSSPIVVERGGTKLLVAQTAWHVLGVDADDGTVHWEERILGPGKNHRLGNALCNVPVHVDGRLFCTTGYGPVVWTTFDLAADGKSVATAWHNPAIHPHQEGIVCVDGMLFGTGDVAWEDFDANPDLLVNGKPLRDREDQQQPPPVDERSERRERRLLTFIDRESGQRHRTGLVCQDLRTGKVLGVRYAFPRIGFSGLMMAVADDMIHGAWSDKCDEVWLIDTSPAMEINGSFRLPERENDIDGRPLIAITNGRYSAPVIADGKLLVRTRDRLFAYDIRESPPRSRGR